MKKFIVIEGIELAYVEANSNLIETIFFVHNNSGSSGIWSQQIEDPLFSKYRLIAFDLPAHGDSSASETPEKHYGLKDLSRVLSMAVQKLAINKRYVLVGLSIGTCIIAEALAQLKPDGIVLVSPTILSEGISFFSIAKPGVDSSPLFIDVASEESVTNLFSAFPFSDKPDLLANLLEDYYRVKAPFRSTIFHQSVAGSNSSDHIGLLKKAGIPVLVVTGIEEEVINPDYLDSFEFNRWHNTIYKLPSAGHFVHLDQPEKFNKLLLNYVEERFTEYHAS